MLASACGTRAEPLRFYALRDEPPPGEPLPPRRPRLDLGPWELSMRMELPGSLDRDTLQRLTGAAGLEPLTGHRWAEPLRDALPRVLLRDLQTLIGPDRVWAAPAPPVAAALARLQVTVQALQAGPRPDRLRLAARWWWVPTGAATAAAAARAGPAVGGATGGPAGPSGAPGASGPPTLPAGPALPPAGEADFSVTLADASPDALAAGHRLAVWRLARAVVEAAGA